MNFGGIPLEMLRVWGPAEPSLPHLLHPWLHMDAGFGWGYPMGSGKGFMVWQAQCRAGTDRYRTPSFQPSAMNYLIKGNL